MRNLCACIVPTQVANDSAARMLSLALLDGFGTEGLFRVPGFETSNNAQRALRVEALVWIVVLSAWERELDEILAVRDGQDRRSEGENGSELHI